MHFGSLSFSQKAIVLALVVAGLTTTARSGQQDAAGHWEGAIRLPGTELKVLVDLVHDAAAGWSGTIDIPAQGLHRLQLGGIAVAGMEVAFAMPGIPGDPKFSGKLTADSQNIGGDFSQHGGTFPFHIARTAARTVEAPSKGVPGRGLVGYWQGSLRPAPLVELRLVLDISSPAPGQLAGVVISVDQGGARIPIAKASETGGAVRLDLPSVVSDFTGTLNTDGSEITGTWTQAGKATPLVFLRLARAPDFSRPQDPKKPYPYSAEEVSVPVKAGVTLAGTLTLPPGDGPHPAVVLVTGSGPQDRDEALMGHRPFLVLADHLTRAGIAVLRCDDRGIGKSTGDFAQATHEDFADDALAGFAFLRERKDIDPAKVGIIGHSEGGIVAPLAAVKKREVAFIVLLAGVGVPVEELLVRQGEDIARVMGVAAETTAKNTALQREIFRAVREEQDETALQARLGAVFDRAFAALSAEQRQAIGEPDAMRATQVRTLCTPWFRKLLTYDPRPVLEAVKCPVLALNGDKDVQVAATENLDAIRAALTAGGNQNVETRVLPGRNHLFQKCQTGATAEYGQIEETFDPEALKMISDWIRKVTGREAQPGPKP